VGARGPEPGRFQLKGKGIGLNCLGKRFTHIKTQTRGDNIGVGWELNVGKGFATERKTKKTHRKKGVKRLGQGCCATQTSSQNGKAEPLAKKGGLDLRKTQTETKGEEEEGGEVSDCVNYGSHLLTKRVKRF